MLAGIIVVMQIEGHVLQPFLLGRAVKLHPLAVLLAIAIGIIVGGIVGALMAVPLLAFTKSFIQYLAGGGRTAPGPAALAAGSAAPPEPMAPSLLVGRDRERAVLRERLDRGRAGQGGLVLVSGEPGIGKSSLLADFAAYARGRRGRSVLTGRAVPGSGPYRAFSEALMPPVRAGRVTETPELRPFRGALGRILPGWAPPGPPETGRRPGAAAGRGRAAAAAGARRRRSGCWCWRTCSTPTRTPLALLDYLAPAVAELPILLVGSQADRPRPAGPGPRCPRPGCGWPGSPTRRWPRWSTASAGAGGGARMRSCSGPRACRWSPRNWPPSLPPTLSRTGCPRCRRASPPWSTRGWPGWTPTRAPAAGRGGRAGRADDWTLVPALAELDDGDGRGRLRPGCRARSAGRRGGELRWRHGAGPRGGLGRPAAARAASGSTPGPPSCCWPGHATTATPRRPSGWPRPASTTGRRRSGPAGPPGDWTAAGCTARRSCSGGPRTWAGRSRWPCSGSSC